MGGDEVFRSWFFSLLFGLDFNLASGYEQRRTSFIYAVQGRRTYCREIENKRVAIQVKGPNAPSFF